MKNKRIQEIIKKYLSGEETREGKTLFEKWYNSFDDSTSSLPTAESEKLESEILSRIEEKIGKAEREAFGERKLRRWTGPQLFKVASVFVGLLIIASVLFATLRHSASYQQVSTAYGQTRKIKLPDHSTIVLNANSTIKYKKEWKKNQDREVWLEGEAFFSVVHTSNNNKFIVRTSKDYKVQVLGTQFVVYDRKKAARVILTSGKVKIDLAENKDIYLNPGELAELNPSVKQFKVRNVNPVVYSSWVQKKLIFKNTSLREITSMLEDSYGVHVIVEDASVLDQKVSGSVSSSNLDNLIFGLQESVGLDIQRQGDQLIFKTNTN